MCIRDRYGDLIGRTITQSTSDGTARGTISSYDPETFVLKYIQDRSLNVNPTTNDTTDYKEVSVKGKVLSFQSTGDIDNDLFNIAPDAGFTGITTTINNKNINLGVDFTNGLATPEINKKTGDVIYIDNRKEVERNIRQKEDVKIILEF